MKDDYADAKARCLCACGRPKSAVSIRCAECRRISDRARHYLTCDHCRQVFYRKSVDRRWRWTACSKACQDAIDSRNKTQDREARFWARVEKTETCWLWRGQIKKGGYGEFSWMHGTPIAAHRAAVLLDRGLTPEALATETHVCHSCDVRACVNPAHLWLGTALDNIRDAWKKGRMTIRKGERHHMRKLSNNAVVAIRADGRPNAEIATEHGVSASLIYQVKTRRIWKHIAEPPPSRQPDLFQVSA